MKKTTIAIIITIMAILFATQAIAFKEWTWSGWNVSNEGGNFTADYIIGDYLCIGTSCRNSWSTNSTEEIQDNVMNLALTGGTQTQITVTYQDASDNFDFVVDSLGGDLGGTLTAATVINTQGLGLTNISNWPTCAGTDKLTSDGSNVTCAVDTTGAGAGTGNFWIDNGDIVDVNRSIANFINASGYYWGGTPFPDLFLNISTVFGGDVTGTYGALTLAANAVNDDEINYSSVTLGDFRNDAQYLQNSTTVNSNLGNLTVNLNITVGSGQCVKGIVGGSSLCFEADGDIRIE